MIKAVHVSLNGHEAIVERGKLAPLLDPQERKAGDVRFSPRGELIVLNAEVETYHETLAGVLVATDHDTGKKILDRQVAIHDACFFLEFLDEEGLSPLPALSPYLRAQLDEMLPPESIPWDRWKEWCRIPGGGDPHPDGTGSSRMVYSRTPSVIGAILDPEHADDYLAAMEEYLIAEAARATTMIVRDRGPWIAALDPKATLGQDYHGAGSFRRAHGATEMHGRPDGGSLGLKPANDLHLAVQQFVDIAALTGSEAAYLLAVCTLESAASRQQFRSGEPMNSGHNIRGAGWFLHGAACLYRAFGGNGTLEHLRAYCGNVLDSWDQTSGAAGGRHWTALTKQQDDHLRPTASFNAFAAQVKADFGVTLDPKEVLRYQSGPMSMLTLHGLLLAKEAGLVAGREKQAQQHEDALAAFCVRSLRHASREINDCFNVTLPRLKNRPAHLPDVRVAYDLAPRHGFRSDPWHNAVVGWMADTYPPALERLALHRPGDADEILRSCDEIVDYMEAVNYYGTAGRHWRSMESCALTVRRRGWLGGT